MEDDDLEARIAARKERKKKKKDPSADGGEGAEGEVRKKKKKKKRPKAPDQGGEEGGGGSASALLEERIRAKQSAPGEGEGVEEGGERRKKKKKKKKDRSATGGAVAAAVNAEDDNQDEEVAAAVATATVGAVMSTDDIQDSKRNLYDESNFTSDADLAEKIKYDDADVIDLDQEGMDDNTDANGHGMEATYDYAGANIIEADTEIMAEINNEGVVQVDESGGIQAFVAETIAVEGDDVGIIKSDAEIEKEEKRKYTKYFCMAVAALVVVIVAVAVPVTLKYAKGRQETRITVVTYEPTSNPSTMPSEAPSSMPSSIRFTEIVQRLQPLSGTELKRQGSPQYLAAMWMADDDPLRLPYDDESKFARFQQRYIMALFYFAMDGTNWNENRGWLTEDSECLWYGIDGASDGCGGEGRGGCIARSVFEGDYDKVCRVGMGRLNSLYGQLPDELGELTEMRWFEIQDDYLYGTIPPALGKWRKLHTMLLGGNYLQGGFPDTFTGNEILGTIFIDRNKFNSTFPKVFETLRNLEWLDAEGNDFAGNLPSGIGRLKQLRILNVNNNSLVGPLPDTWDETNLIEDLEVAHNGFDGPLPESLSQAKWLKDLRASNNQLTGSIPVSYYGLENLEELYLDQNQMTGELPQTKELFYDGLQEFSIHDNAFEGRFPVEHFEDTFRIKVLSLHRNQLTGSITANICARKDANLAYTQINVLTADCNLIRCSCCTCYGEDGELMPGTGS